MDNHIIVIGGNHHNTLGVLRSLGEAGKKCSLILLSRDKTPYVSKSKYIDHYLKINELEEILEALNKLLFNNKLKPVVIACSDSIASYIDTHMDELSSNFILPGTCKQGELTRLMNKEIMAELAIQSGIKVPKSWIVQYPDFDISNVTFPCIVKPLVSKEGSKADIRICYSLSDLNHYFSSCKCSRLQIQEYIDKEYEFQIIGCSLNSGRDVIIPGASIILRQPNNTNTGFLRYVPKNNFIYDEQSCIDFIKKTGYSGLFSLEFLRGKNGLDYFMEVNFRNDGNAICVTASGINLPFIWYLASSGREYVSKVNYSKLSECIVMPEFDDFSNVMSRKISLYSWIKDVLKTDRFMEFSFNDQLPFWIRLKQLILGHLCKNYTC